jgi:hypothetical protein
MSIEIVNLYLHLDSLVLRQGHTFRLFLQAAKVARISGDRVATPAWQ